LEKQRRYCILIVRKFHIKVERMPVNQSLISGKEVRAMTALRQSAIMELEKIPEDKLSFVIQIMQGVNGLYNNSNKERKEAFARLEQLRKKGTVTDYDAELASYREDKYGR